MDCKKIGMTLIGTAGITFLAGLPYKIDTGYSSLYSSKIKQEVRIAVIADLHCAEFGKGQKRLMKVIRRVQPDLILIPGDLFDYERNYEHSYELIRRLKEYPVYFTSGNHERYLRKDIRKIRENLKGLGVHVLEDRAETVQVRGQELEIGGLSDHGSHPHISQEMIEGIFHSNCYRILMSHRPGWTQLYQDATCDLIVSGHAHGGQWRIPYTHQGIINAERELLPKYTEGLHNLNGRTLYISRGLASGNPAIPRLYNNPEVGVLRLKPKE